MKVAKTQKQLTARQMAEQTVDLFLEVLFSSDQDAGWQGDNILGKLVDFKGDLPMSSGFAGFSKVWEKSILLSDWPDAHKMACFVMRGLSDRKREAIAVDRSYRGRTKMAIDPFTPEKRVEIRWTDARCASYLDCTVNAFRKRINEGYQALEEILQENIQKAA